MNLFLVSAMPGEHKEKKYFRLEFQKFNYLSDVVQKLT